MYFIQLHIQNKAENSVLWKTAFKTVKASFHSGKLSVDWNGQEN
jgi:hypothetical protein